MAVVAVPASIYGIGYGLRGPASRPVQAAFPLLVWSMMMVPAAGNVSGLIAFWELMAISSLVLVLAEHHHNPETRVAAQWYAAMTQLSLLAIVVALLVFAHAAGGRFVRSNARRRRSTRRGRRVGDVPPRAPRLRSQGRRGARPRLATEGTSRGTEPCLGADERSDGEAR